MATDNLTAETGKPPGLILICDRVIITQGQYAGMSGMVVGHGRVNEEGEYDSGGVRAYHVQFEEFGLPPDPPSSNTPRWVRANWVAPEK